MAFELTSQQAAAVTDRGGNLLVSAAAGSGKTRVLVERLMDYVKSGEDIDRFLIITFTNASAAELRDRIARAVSELLAQNPADRHLRRNATLVYKAPISTIDASALIFSGSAAPPPGSTRISACAMRRRERRWASRPWRRCWNGGIRTSGTTPPLPRWWTHWPGTGTTRRWKRWYLTSTAGCRATRSRCAG